MITDPEEDYARGWVPFLGQKIFLDSRPLIPRVETEFWAEKAISAIQGTARVLDLFAGSGCIGIAVLAHVPGATVDFGELEARHFPTIEKSLRENGIDPSHTRMIQTDVWSNIHDHYDVILANPPYLAVLNPGLALEPPEALLAEDGGFALIEKTLAGARDHLNLRGVLWIEHDSAQAERIKGEHHPDQFGRMRYTVFHA